MLPGGRTPPQAAAERRSIPRLGPCRDAAFLDQELQAHPDQLSLMPVAWLPNLRRRGRLLRQNADFLPTNSAEEPFLEGKTVCETVNLTNHSTKAIDRYITNFRQVFTCQTKGLTTQETSLATKLSPNLVEEYKHLFKEYAITDSHFKTLLSHP